MQSALRRSQRALPIEIVFAAIAYALLWWVERAFGWATWIAWIVVGILTFTIVGEIFNVVYLRIKLRALGHDGFM